MLVSVAPKPEPMQPMTGVTTTVDSTTEPSEQLVMVPDSTQSVLSSLEPPLPPPCCAFNRVGVSQPEKTMPSASVAITINASSIGRRPASFNTFLLMFFGLSQLGFSLHTHTLVVHKTEASPYGNIIWGCPR